MNLRHQGVSVRYALLSLSAAAASAALLYLLYRDLDFASFWQALKSANLGWLVVLSVTLPLEQGIRAWKWRQLLYDLKPIPVRRYFGAIMAGYAVTSIVSLGVSPLVRSWLIARLENLCVATVLTSAVLERLIDGLVFGCIVAGFVLFGKLPVVEGQLRSGLAVAAAFSLVLFSLLILLLFRLQRSLAKPASFTSRLFYGLAKRVPRLRDLAPALSQGVTYPHSTLRQSGIVLAAFGMKLVALSHFAWAGLALGVRLSFNDYLFLLIFVSFIFLLSRFIRIPGGFVLAAAYALNLLGVADETALSMILFVTFFTLAVTLALGFWSLYASGLSLRDLREAEISTSA